MKNILLCVTGGIAAYKSIDLASQLIKQGFEVKTILTRNALEFVTELNFTTITHNFAYSEMFQDSRLRRNDGRMGNGGKVLDSCLRPVLRLVTPQANKLSCGDPDAQDDTSGTYRNDGRVGNDGTVRNDSHDSNDPLAHISLADWADLIVVAPATANMIAKAAHGIADDLMSSVLLAHTKPILWVPAMNVHMYEHPATQSNMETLSRRGNYVLEPATGMLACGYEGKGKFPPVEEILYGIKTYLHYTQDLKGKKILITAGGTAEAIDPMRQITNCSSGKTGIAIARAAALRGAIVYLVYGYVAVALPYNLHEAIFAPSVSCMQESVEKLFTEMDIIIMAAAVSDYTPIKTSKEKIKKQPSLTLEFKQTPDILAGLGKNKKKSQILIGFAAESENLMENAKSKLKKKNLDFIVANHLNVSGKDNTEIVVISGKTTKSIKADKFDAANFILDCTISI